MTQKTLTLTSEQQVELLEDGKRWWMIPAKNHFRTERFTAHENRKGVDLSTKYIRTIPIKESSKMVWCEAIKVNAKTIVLALPDGKRGKRKIGDVFILQEMQEAATNKIKELGSEEILEKFQKNESFFVTQHDLTRPTKEEKENE